MCAWLEDAGRNVSGAPGEPQGFAKRERVPRQSFRSHRHREHAVEATADTADTSDTSSATAATSAADGIEGTWTIDTETGAFDHASATGTFVGFRIAEELAGIGSTEAVGRTGDVTGSITIEGTTLTIHGMTNRVQVPIRAQLVDGTVVVMGSVDITFSDFGVEVPASQIVVSAEDHGTLELQLLLTAD